MGTKYWQEFLIPYHQAVDEIVLKFNSLKEQYEKIGEYSPIESVYGRVKSVSSILEKIHNYGVDIESLEDNIQDIAGVRIMCQFEEDIYEVVELIKKRSACDMEIVKVKDYISEAKPSGYKSYHLIIRYPVFSVAGIQHLFVEIQIRTLAMNFWSIIEHSLNYKYKENIPDEVRLRLVNAANAVNDVDHEMSSIREEIQNAQRLFGLKSSSVTSILDNIGHLYKLNQGEKASRYEKIFDDLFEQEDIIQLILLRKELETEVNTIESEA
ncbi:GTP pyrophosphokinase family protein [Acetobacterium paludosum]|uniref:GTP pyrophosphokinase family protein n=1 Tax=Acetobacterium paludosum TaxID=52693 RepID=A0A923HVT5_9FIRM|nr:GTP pyrophosphokinase family protein [Acetobacterium paludosum]MBC3889448.1 GTP pyrophosphokinase family protein [Acetobacterium paludosum]